MINSWLVRTFPNYIELFKPKKEDMDKILTLKLPPRWEEVERCYFQGGMINISLAHINPAPRKRAGVAILKQGSGVVSALPSLKPERFDYVGHLSIGWYKDEKTACQFFENYQAPVPSLTPGQNVPLEDLIKAYVPKEKVKELEKGIKEFELALEKGKAELAEFGAKIKKGKYLGEEALLVMGKDGKRGVQAVLINNFVITGMLLMSDAFPPGSTPEHKNLLPDCGCKKPLPCSTVKGAGLPYREEVEQINRSIFSRIKSVEIPKKEFKKILAELAEIEKELQPAGIEILEKSAEELYKYDRENVERLFELYGRGLSSEFLNMLKSEYFTMRYQVRANQSIREKPPKEYDGYVFLGRSIVKNAVTWAVHIQVLKFGRPEDLTNVMGGVRVKKGMGEDIIITDTYKKIGEL